MVVLEVADELFEDTGVTVIKLRGVASRVAIFGHCSRLFRTYSSNIALFHALLYLVQL